jgi:hypothetical protein
MRDFLRSQSVLGLAGPGFAVNDAARSLANQAALGILGG